MASARTRLLSPQIKLPKYENAREIFSLAVKIFGNCFGFILKATLLLYLPFHILENFFAFFSQDHGGLTRLVFMTLNSIVATFLAPALLVPTLLFGISRQLKTKTAPALLKAYHFGLRFWGRALGQSFEGGLLILLGLLMLLVPGIYLAAAYMLLIPVICFEDTQDPLQRSRELTLGKRDLLFRFIFVFFLRLALLVLAIALIFELLGWIFGFKESATVKFLFGTAISCVVTVCAGVYTIGSMLIYLKLRKDKGKRPKETWFLRWAP